MTLAEYFFRIEKVREADAATGGDCDFWSVDDQNTYYYFTAVEGRNGEALTEVLCDFDFFTGDMLFVEWKTLQPLFEIGISGDLDVAEEEPLMRNQVIAIRGTCTGQCAELIKPYYGYTTRTIPCCEPIYKITNDGEALFRYDAELEIQNLKADKDVKVGTSVWSQKNATFEDMLLDAAVWAKCCKCMDAVIFNLDCYLEMTRSDTASAYAAIHMKDGQLEVVTGEALKKLYRKYCKYPAADYDLEETISDSLGCYFKFERQV